MPRTIVVNNREALVIGQMPHMGKDAGGIPQLGKQIILVPGVNLVDSKDLAELRKNKSFELNFTTKIPRSLAPEQNPEMVGRPILVAGKEVPERKSLEKLDAKEIIDLIEETFAVGLLKEWLEEEGRNEVRAKVSNRITLLESGGDPVVGA